MTGFEFKKDKNSITLNMRSDNPESEKWPNIEWYKWIKGWMETMINLSDCGVIE